VAPSVDDYDALILAGGRASRLGGTDKPSLPVGGISLLDRVLLAASAASRRVVVGPRRPTARPVRWAREHPVGGGPVAAIAAGLSYIHAPSVAVLAADLPFAAPAVPRLLAALDRHDGAVLVDDTGHDQPLLACYRTSALHEALSPFATPAGVAVRRLIGPLDLVRIPAVGDEALDCDTEHDLARARHAAAAVG
jgi:molybdopterin-guanine dinucleotide biosynthesis protein A